MALSSSFSAPSLLPSHPNKPTRKPNASIKPIISHLSTFSHKSNGFSQNPIFFLKPTFSLKPIPLSLRPPMAIGPDGKFYPDPSEDEPPEVPEDSAHGVSKFQQVARQAAKARQQQERQYKEEQSIFLAAIAQEHDPPEPSPETPNSLDDGDDLFGEIDKAIALKRKEFVDQGLLSPNPPKKKEVEGIEELLPEEVLDLEEIEKLQGLTIISEERPKESLEREIPKEVNNPGLDSNFDIYFDQSKENLVRIVEPKFSMSLIELLDGSRVVPVMVLGDTEVVIKGIQHDSREVNPGDLFVCCVGHQTDGHLHLREAEKRGAVAVVASKEITLDESLGCRAVVMVEDTKAVLPALAASFYGNPSRKLSVIGITGTNGKTTTSYLLKGMYEAMALRTGLLGTVAYYVHGNNQIESSNTTPDEVLVQKLMAKMVHNGTEAVVMEVSSHALVQGQCDEVDFDIAVFTNLTRDHSDYHGTEEDYRNAKAKLFAKMVDPDRHRKVVNSDDPNAPFFIAQGNPEVPVVTFAMENKNADVYPLKFELSLFESQVLVNTPQGILEISSGLLGRHNILNILAAVAVGIAVGAPLEDIVRGIEEVDAVPGRCELIDEEQAFAVIVDYARTPDALSRLLDTVRELGPKRVITVFGCAGESDRGKRPMMTKIATDKSDVVLLTSDNPKTEDPLDILDDMLAGVGWTMQDYLRYGENDYYPPLRNGHRLFLHDIRRVAVRAAVAMGEEGDIVVVSGKGHETYQIEGDKKEFFDDREECREALQYVDELHQAGIDTSEFPWRLPESH
ncbi:hypothetical protein AMTRI_Chr07g80780 [Amborella trichopoda]